MSADSHRGDRVILEHVFQTVKAANSQQNLVSKGQWDYARDRRFCAGTGDPTSCLWITGRAWVTHGLQPMLFHFLQNRRMADAQIGCSLSNG